MIGLEYILQITNIQHQELSELLGIKKQNINLWLQKKQKISKRHMPFLIEKFQLSEDILQDDLTKDSQIIILEVILNNLKNK